MSSRSRPARYGIGKSATRKNRPQMLTPWWHDEVRKVVEKEKQINLRGQSVGIGYRDVINEMNPSLKKSQKRRKGFIPEAWFGILDQDPEIILSVVGVDAGYLLHPLVVDVIRAERAKAQNAVGRDEWNEATEFFDKLSESLTGISSWDTPGFPRWFWRCIPLEFEATRKDVNETIDEYKQLPEKKKLKMSLDTFMRRKLNLRHCRLGTPRQSTAAIMAERWGVSANTVENWLRPAKRPGYVPVEKRPIFVFKRRGKKIIYDTRKWQPPTRKGRPRKKKE